MLSKKGVMKNGTLNVDTLVQVSKQAFQEDGRELDEALFRKGVSDCNSTSKLKRL
ncbi:hypothetical protein L798_08150 [Zootermopsis nevadensis]|uniref:Uncharacterized protein n=1 Tax=Zootermopsis nevadensis TaxID=136037 RepID=A0A067QEK4_ZOONE|nr:hypothetical protein L798_08150 [Zootermopsis nevadensis]